MIEVKKTIQYKIKCECGGEISNKRDFTDELFEIENRSCMSQRILTKSLQANKIPTCEKCGKKYLIKISINDGLKIELEEQ